MIFEGRQVVIIQDDRGIAGLLRAAFREQGAEPFVIMTHEGAMEFVSGDEWNNETLFILDSSLSGNSESEEGRVIAQSLRDKGFLGSIIVYSGIMRYWPEIEINRYLVTPVSSSLLYDAVEKSYKS